MNADLKTRLYAKTIRSPSGTEEIVEYCKRVSIPGDPIYGRAALARKFGVKRACISKVVNGKRWVDNENRRVSGKQKAA